MYGMVWYGMVWTHHCTGACAVQCSAVQCSAVQWVVGSAAQHSPLISGGAGGRSPTKPDDGGAGVIIGR
jgi:hypothetical protein